MGWTNEEVYDLYGGQRSFRVHTRDYYCRNEFTRSGTEYCGSELLDIFIEGLGEYGEHELHGWMIDIINRKLDDQHCTSLGVDY